MPLNSRLFRGDAALEACLTRDEAHLVPGSSGDAVSKIQTALLVIDDVSVAPGELQSKHYGPSTAAAVLAYKTRRKIINTAYQKSADNIVGKMTIAAMDVDMVAREHQPPSSPQQRRNLAST